MLAPEEEMRLLGIEAERAIDDTKAEVVAAAKSIRANAYELGRDDGFRAGVIAAGEPWVALFAGVVGALLGFAFARLAHGG